MMVRNCMIHPLPDLDPTGQLLRELDCAVTGLQLTDPKRLYGDAALIADGIAGLRIVLDRIEALQIARQAAE